MEPEVIEPSDRDDDSTVREPEAIEPPKVESARGREVDPPPPASMIPPGMRSIVNTNRLHRRIT